MYACDGGNQSEATQAATEATTQAIETEVETNAPETEALTRPCVLTVKDQDGNPVPDVSFELRMGGIKVADGISDAQGKATVSLADGAYVVVFTQVPEYYDGETNANIEVTENAATFDVAVKNITPNGEVDRPFVITQDTTEITLPANGTYHYIFYGGMNRYLYIENTTVNIIYKEQTYTPDENGNLKVVPVVDGTRDPITFAICNTTGAEVSFSLLIQANLGSMDRPIEITELNEKYTATVPKESTVYYFYQAKSDGIVMVSSPHTKNNITLQNTRNSAQSYYTNGSACEYMVVKKDDVVTIAVAATGKDDSVDIPFAVSEFAGTQENPVLLHKEKMAIHFDANASYFFGIGQIAPEHTVTIVVKGEGVEVKVGDQTYMADEEGKLQVEVSTAFEVVNTSKENGCEVSIEIVGGQEASTEEQATA